MQQEEACNHRCGMKNIVSRTFLQGANWPRHARFELAFGGKAHEIHHAGKQPNVHEILQNLESRSNLLPSIAILSLPRSRLQKR
jgi:hypothetical protein